MHQASQSREEQPPRCRANLIDGLGRYVSRLLFRVLHGLFNRANGADRGLRDLLGLGARHSEFAHHDIDRCVTIQRRQLLL